jgi:hypothetical protein
LFNVKWSAMCHSRRFPRFGCTAMIKLLAQGNPAQIQVNADRKKVEAAFDRRGQPNLSSQHDGRRLAILPDGCSPFHVRAFALWDRQTDGF